MTQVTMADDDPYKLKRFLDAQKGIYERVTSELRAGRKASHWMWFIFPQIRGLGHTETSILFAIASLPEAEAYLSHPVLGPRLHQCCELLMQIDGRSASQIFGSPDDLKLRSSMTLFAQADSKSALFQSVLNRYFQGTPDQRTLELLEAK
ncbi:DUF1810 domain-containing protein [Granulicella aggregans]|uniref:DUF1810 domain-containing protein n=1 Tax=Granulicella aggregans TaxID=474949 RepID=UPI0021E0EDB4|nr:DUF1810 domain-containing protein [Granulicella aggregans]